VSEVLERAFNASGKWDWQIKTLGEVCRTSSGGTPSRSRSDFFNGNIPWVKSGELNDGLVSEVSEFISEQALAGSSAKLLPAGTLLIAMYGATVGRLGVLACAAATNQAVCAIFPSPELDLKFLFWYLRRQRSNLIAKAVGGAQPNISQTILRDLELPIPPLDKQREIVAEIEKQFSRLDEAVANLQRVKANLKRYKASVLKAAVEGRLVETEAALARREGRIFETGGQLLQRILAERRAKWIGRGKYKEPDMPDSASVLPEGWTWATLDMVCCKITDGTHHSPISFPEGEFRYVTSKNVREFRLDLSDISYVSAAVHEEIYARCDVKYRDVLYVKDGANTGLSSVNTLTEPFSLLSSVGVFRPLEVIDPAYMVVYLNCSHVRDEMLANVAGVAITRLTLAKLKVSRIAVPPRSEQTRIVAEVDRHLSIIREFEAEVDANLQRAQSLRQATLAKVFSTS